MYFTLFIKIPSTFGKVEEVGPPFFSILEQVILLQLFPIPIPFRDMRFWPFYEKSILKQNTDFWEKSFCMEVSIYKSFHMTRNTPTSEILPPLLMVYITILISHDDRVLFLLFCQCNAMNVIFHLKYKH